MESKNTFILHETEAFMRGELDNVTVAHGRIVLDLVSGGHVPYGCYTSPAVPLPTFDALRVSWNAGTRHPVYINGDRLVTFAKMVGGIDDENILEMLRTAKGFRKLVHSVGVSIVGDLPDKVVTFTLGFSGELGSGGSRNSMKITTDGTEHIMVMDEQQWSDSDETPQEFLFELVKPRTSPRPPSSST